MPDHKDEAQFYSELLRAYFDSANDAIFVLCDEMKFLTCNKMTQQWLGSSEDELTQHNKRIPITELLGNPDSIDFFTFSFKQALDNKKVFFETRINPPNGKDRWIELSMKRVDIENGDMVIAIARDITDRKKDIATIEYKTNYDFLTNLPNRSYLAKSFLTENSSPYNKNESLTLLSIDLDRFKEINGSLGQQAGDIVLQEMARRLSRIIDPASNELLARLEGDEFAVILPNTGTNEARDIATRIQRIISKPITFGTNKISMDCSIGIASYPEHTKDKSELIQYAESAMYSAKANKQGIGVYDFATHKLASERLQLITDLRQAIKNNKIIPHYQPIINMVSCDEVCLEALARWKHKTHGFISPEIFIPLSEETGMIYALTLSIMTRAIEECSALLKRGVIKKLSINISAYCMTNHGIISEIKKLLIKHSIPAERIIFEITESVMMSDRSATKKIINELHDSGIIFSIDDFGTGHSSLFKLKQLPLSELKVDKSFVIEITTNENDAAIAMASIQMAHALGLEVVAEGIENKESWDMLHIMGCDYAQGFWMAKPMPHTELLNWLKKGNNFN